MDDLKRKLTAFLSEVWSQGNLDAIPRYVADRYRIHHDPGDPWEGRVLDPDGFRDRVATSRAAAPDQVFTPIVLLREGARIAVSWTWRGTHLGDMPGFPASGQEITMSGLTIYDFDGWDRLTGHWQIADRLSVAQHLRAMA